MAGQYGDMTVGKAPYEPATGASSAEGSTWGSRFTPYQASQMTRLRNPNLTMAAVGGPATVDSPGVGLQVAAKQANQRGRAIDASHQAFLAMHGPGSPESRSVMATGRPMMASPVQAPGTPNAFEAGLLAQHAARQAPGRPGIQQGPAMNVGVRMATAGNPDMQGVSQSRAANAPGVAAAGVEPGEQNASAHQAIVNQGKIDAKAAQSARYADQDKRGRGQSPAQVTSIMASQLPQGAAMPAAKPAPRGGPAMMAGGAGQMTPAEMALWRATAMRHGPDLADSRVHAYRADQKEKGLDDRMKLATIEEQETKNKMDPDRASYERNLHAGMTPEAAWASVQYFKAQMAAAAPVADAAPGQATPGPRVGVNSPKPTRPGLPPAPSKALMALTNPDLAGLTGTDKRGDPLHDPGEMLNRAQAMGVSFGDQADPRVRFLRDHLQATYGDKLPGMMQPPEPMHQMLHDAPPLVRRLANVVSMGHLGGGIFGDPVANAEAQQKQAEMLAQVMGQPRPRPYQPQQWGQLPAGYDPIFGTNPMGGLNVEVPDPNYDPRAAKSGGSGKYMGPF